MNLHYPKLLRIRNIALLFILINISCGVKEKKEALCYGATITIKNKKYTVVEANYYPDMNKYRVKGKNSNGVIEEICYKETDEKEVQYPKDSYHDYKLNSLYNQETIVYIDDNSIITQNQETKICNYHKIRSIGSNTNSHAIFEISNKTEELITLSKYHMNYLDESLNDLIYNNQSFDNINKDDSQLLEYNDKEFEGIEKIMFPNELNISDTKTKKWLEGVLKQPINSKDKSQYQIEYLICNPDNKLIVGIKNKSTSNLIYSFLNIKEFKDILKDLKIIESKRPRFNSCSYSLMQTFDDGYFISQLTTGQTCNLYTKTLHKDKINSIFSVNKDNPYIYSINIYPEKAKKKHNNKSEFLFTDFTLKNGKELTVKNNFYSTSTLMSDSNTKSSYIRCNYAISLADIKEIKKLQSPEDEVKKIKKILEENKKNTLKIKSRNLCSQDNYDSNNISSVKNINLQDKKYFMCQLVPQCNDNYNNKPQCINIPYSLVTYIAKEDYRHLTKKPILLNNMMVIFENYNSETNELEYTENYYEAKKSGGFRSIIGSTDYPESDHENFENVKRSSTTKKIKIDSDSDIKMLNPDKYRDSTYSMNFNDKENNKCNKCTICFDTLDLGSVVAKTPCNHYYHATCIEPWVNKKNNCPLCRKEEVFNSNLSYIVEKTDLGHDQLEINRNEYFSKYFMGEVVLYSNNNQQVETYQTSYTCNDDE